MSNNKSMKGKKEVCVSCGCETPYAFETPIQERIGFIEGSGQLCDDCLKEIY